MCTPTCITVTGTVEKALWSHPDSQISAVSVMLDACIRIMNKWSLNCIYKLAYIESTYFVLPLTKIIHSFGAGAVRCARWLKKLGAPWKAALYPLQPTTNFRLKYSKMSASLHSSLSCTRSIKYSFDNLTNAFFGLKYK